MVLASVSISGNILATLAIWIRSSESVVGMGVLAQAVTSVLIALMKTISGPKSSAD